MLIWSVPRSVNRSARLGAVALLVALARAAAAEEAPAVAAAARAAGISVKEDGARWESGYGEKFFQVVGTISNGSPQIFAAIRVRTELLGEGGKVVAAFDSWNARAEALGDLRGEEARTELAKLAPGPIAPGTSDRFRATFLEDETAKFTGHRVRVVDVLPPAKGK